MPVSQPEIVLIGGGVIGLTTALRLAEQGVSVTLLDRQSTGREASWAGAGMLPPGNMARATTPESRLRACSHSLWKDFTAELREQTGIDSGYSVCGALQVFPSEANSDAAEAIQKWEDEGICFQSLSREEARGLVAGLDPNLAQLYFLKDFAQIRNPRHLKALRAACLMRGVEIVEYAEPLSLGTREGTVSEVALPDRRIHFDRICVVAGAWSSNLLQSLGITIPIRPVRGQIVQLQVRSLPFSCIVELGRRYIVPRRDGLILVGSTEEDVGFVKQNTVEGVSGLLRFAEQLVPALLRAEYVRSWSGLRPGSPDGLPLLGAVPGFTNLFIGTGHFRAGLQMSLGTAAILSALMLDQRPPISLDGLQPDRFDLM